MGVILEGVKERERSKSPNKIKRKIAKNSTEGIFVSADII